MFKLAASEKLSQEDSVFKDSIYLTCDLSSHISYFSILSAFIGYFH